MYCVICGVISNATRCKNCEQRYRRLMLAGIHSVQTVRCPDCGGFIYSHEPHVCRFCSQCGKGRRIKASDLCMTCKYPKKVKESAPKPVKVKEPKKAKVKRKNWYQIEKEKQAAFMCPVCGKNFRLIAEGEMLNYCYECKPKRVFP